MPSPFPGMDPYLEDLALWPAFQQQFVRCLYELQRPALGDRYQLRTVTRTHGRANSEDYLEVRRKSDAAELVTLVDIVSPANKSTPEGREAYLQTRRAAKEAGANIVEIDLVLQGAPLLDYSRENMPKWHYAVTVTRSSQPERYEVYPSTLDKRLPRFRLPLAADERDVVVDLQVALARTYVECGAGKKIDYARDPGVPVGEEDRAWLDRQLQQEGFRPLHEKVARLAYALWEREGRPHGRDREHWLQAVRAFDDRKVPSCPAPSKAVRRNVAPEVSMPLEELLDGVCDRETFLGFVEALIRDRSDEVDKEQQRPSPPFGPGANGWENGTIEDFLSAAAAWADVSRDRPEGFPQEASWKAFAEFLYCGKIYE